MSQLCCPALTLCFHTIMTSTLLTLLLFIFGVHAVLTCGPSEYKSANEECCPMCNIGSVVSQDCHSDSSTICKPCSRGTFMNEPNGLRQCFPCKTCGTGLYILHHCTTITDAVCEVLDGYYCSGYSDGECSHATKHSVCEPGQQIKTPGSKTSDTVCEPCSPGFYSPEGVNCSKWTDCSVNNEIEDQKGTSTRDVKCKPKTKIRERYDLIAAAIVVIVAVVAVLLLSQASKRRAVQTSPVEETMQECSESASSSAGARPILDEL